MMSRMRTGRRDIRSAWGIALWASFASAGPTAPRQAPAGPPIRMTVEVDWDVPALPVVARQSRGPSPTPLPTADPSRPRLSVSEGRIVEVQGGAGASLQARADGSWVVGSGMKGRARVRVESPMGSELVVKVSGQSFRTTLGSLLEGLAADAAALGSRDRGRAAGLGSASRSSSVTRRMMARSSPGRWSLSRSLSTS